MLKFVSVAGTKQGRFIQRCCTNKHRTSEKEESEKWQHRCEPVGHGVLVELSPSTGKGGSWEGSEGQIRAQGLSCWLQLSAGQPGKREWDERNYGSSALDGN